MSFSGDYISVEKKINCCISVPVLAFFYALTRIVPVVMCADKAATNSVTVTRPAAYMESLTAGTHTFNFNFKDGSTSASVNVVEAATTTTKATAAPTGTNTQKQVKEVPKTADTATPMLYLAVVLVSGCAVFCLGKRKNAK